MLALVSPKNQVHIRELADAHRMFKSLFKQWMTDALVAWEQLAESKETMDLDMIQFPDGSLVEYILIHKMPEEVTIQIMARLDWVDRAYCIPIS